MWDGKGFPPVGTKCNATVEGVCEEVTIIGCVAECKGGGKIESYRPDIFTPIKTEWNGEGFPPAGTCCEVKYRNEWILCFIVGMDDLGNCVARNDSVYIATQLTENFRPLRTEREIAQGDMFEIARANPTASMVELFGLFHDAGYHK